MHLRLTSILTVAGDGPAGHGQDLDTVFARIASETAGIQDIDARMEAVR
ncbi:hypothetical protein [Kitasatospora sp. NBC_01287]|nr:hypothetical protein [Kitasatospora sp. NBC_01287]